MIPADIDVRAVELGPSHAFLLSHIDGVTTLDELIQLVPFPEEEAIQVLRDLHDRGLIALPAGATRAGRNVGAMRGIPTSPTQPREAGRPRRPSAPYIEVRRERNSTPLPPMPPGGNPTAGPSTSAPPPSASKPTTPVPPRPTTPVPPRPTTPVPPKATTPVPPKPTTPVPPKPASPGRHVPGPPAGSSTGRYAVVTTPSSSTGKHAIVSSAGPGPAASTNSPPPSAASTSPPAPAVPPPTVEDAATTTRTPLAVNAVPTRPGARKPQERTTPVPKLSPAEIGPSAGIASVDNAEPGAIIADRYRLLRKIGHGGMGVVFLAEHVVLEKQFALKILNDDMARRPELVQRFLLEAKATSRIVHENIVDIVDFGQTAWGSVFFAMEYLRGEDLATCLRRVRYLNAADARAICVQICRALEAAHDRGIVHRDVKPANILLIERDGKKNFVKVLDFGIAKLTYVEPGSSGEPQERLTRAGMVFGTPEYIAPEQARGDAPVAAPADIYSVGCILYELLTGDVPFSDETIMKTLLRQMLEAPQPPSARAPQRHIPADLEQVVMRALQKDPSKRYATMREMADALLACA